MKSKTYKSKVVSVFHSFEEEAEYEYNRRAQQTPLQRWDELSKLQDRVFGKDWRYKKIEKVVSYG